MSPPLPHEPLASILDSPALPEYLRVLEQTMRRESVERERFRDKVTPRDKAEFINGEVVMHSPARVVHNDVLVRLVTLVKTHLLKSGLGGLALAEKAMIGLSRNDYEPDLVYFGPEKAATIAPDQMILPAPDLVVEILSPSTERIDRTIKREDYAAHGVAEYWIVDPDLRTIEQNLLPAGARGYPPAQPVSASGEIASPTIPGLVVPVAALFDDFALGGLLRTLS